MSKINVNDNNNEENTHENSGLQPLQLGLIITGSICIGLLILFSVAAYFLQDNIFLEFGINEINNTGK